VSLLAAGIVYMLHKRSGNLLPGKDILLVTGTMALAVAGVSYFKTREQFPGERVSTPFLYAWPALLTLVFGVLIGIGVEKPSIPDWAVYCIAFVLFLLCIAWSTIIWLHEQGIIADMRNLPVRPKKTAGLDESTAELPHVPAGGQP